MKLHRTFAAPLVAALTVGLSVPALATAAFAADSGKDVTVSDIETSGYVEDDAFTAAWDSTSPILYVGETHDDGSVAFADAGGVTFTTSDSTSSQAFGLVPVHVTLASVATEPSLVQTGAAFGIQLRGDLDGDGKYNGPDYFTLVRYGEDDWRLSSASGTAVKALDADRSHHSLADWQTVLGKATVQDVGVSLGSGAPGLSATILSLTFDGTTYTFEAPTPFAKTTTKIAGTATVGQKLTADLNGWDPAPTTISYAWRAAGSDALLGIAASYTPTAADLNKQLTLTVTGSADGYAPATTTSALTTGVAAGAFTSSTKPAIPSSAKVGQKLTVSNGTWSHTPTSYTYTYRWLRGSTQVGTNASSYTPTATDNGQLLSVQVTAHVAGYTDVTVQSNSAKVGPGSLSAATPRISGTKKVGYILTATPGTWTSGTGLAYQWNRNGAKIAGATKTVYTLAAADRGNKVTITVTGSENGYTAVSKTSAPTSAIAYGTFSHTTTPAVSGTVRVGNKLTAKPGTWAPTARLSYQWKQNGHSISGATRSTYTPSASYLGKKLTVTVTARRAGYTTVSKTSASHTVGHGVFSAPKPKITGTHHTGKTLKVSVGTWSPKPSLSYQWKRNGSKIKGATHSSYKTTSSDRGKKITVTVTGRKSAYSTKSETSSSAYITAPFSRTHAPTITGTTRIYSTLKAHVPSWTPKASKVSYQWKRDGTSISGATHSTYKLAAADYHHKISVAVTGQRSTYTTASRTSAKTASISGPKATLTHDGDYKVGSGIAPGTYISSSSASSCYWERRRSAGDSLSGIITNDIGAGQRIVTIASSDKYFSTDGCGSWTRYIAGMWSPHSSVASDGVYAVGSQLRPGTYKSSGPAKGSSMCYWERDADFLGDLDSINENGDEFGSVYVKIHASDKAFLTDGCAKWTRVGS